MVPSYIITDEIEWVNPSFIEFLLLKLGSGDYELHNAVYLDGKILKDCKEIQTWYKISSGYNFEKHGEVVLDIESSSWWGLTMPIEQMNEMTLRKIELELIEDNIGALIVRKEELLMEIDDYSDALQMRIRAET